MRLAEARRKNRASPIAGASAASRIAMSASPRQVRAASGASAAKAPVAKPPVRPVVASPFAPESSVFQWNWWTPEARSGWAGSLVLHLAFLTILACWYFAPSTRGPVVFDSRLAGSPNGVPEGEMLKGGLNTPLAMPTSPLGEAEVGLESPAISQLELTALEPELRFRGTTKPSGAGGQLNTNPGAGDGDGFGLARFGEGGELIRGVSVKVGDPQFTLLWNTDGVDLDLHVIEPGGKEIYWEEPKGTQGGELDVDNTKGFGPENVYWLVAKHGPGSEKVKGPGPPGVYKWFVVYWGGFGGLARPTHWQVRVKHAGKVSVHHGKFQSLNERSRTYTLKVDPPPGGTVPAAKSKDAP